jgi:hypothetical protein
MTAHFPDPRHGGEPDTRTATDTSRPGARIGPYYLPQELGERGMGVVWLAEQHTPVRRHVALRVIKAGMDTRQVVLRFEAEDFSIATCHFWLRFSAAC